MRQGPAPVAFPATDQVVARARHLFDDALVGVVVFGSWARGELRESSDIDVLVVVARRVPIRRALYRRWDEQPDIFWERHLVEPHFAHLPDGSRTPSGFWAEVATDGHVLLDAQERVSAYLATVRQAVASGRLQRHKLHGHPYWVEN